jgi:protein associated with RNAse G/E
MLQKAEIRKMLVSGDQWGAWQGYQLPVSNDYVTIWTPLGTAMHWKPGTWIAKHHQVSYFWNDAWYTLHISYHPDGSFSGAYCDVVLPTSTYTSTAHELIYIDLYIDVVARENVVARNGVEVYTKDHEVFDRAALRYPIVEQSRKQAFETLDWLEEHAKHWSGPFSVIPKHLPRTDFETLTPAQVHAAWQS